MNQDSEQFLPAQESARIAVERARQIVKENNQMIQDLKNKSGLESSYEESEEFIQLAEQFSEEDSYAFDLHKIKSSSGFGNFVKDIFGVH